MSSRAFNNHLIGKGMPPWQATCLHAGSNAAVLPRANLNGENNMKSNSMHLLPLAAALGLAASASAHAAVYDMTFYGIANSGNVPANISGYTSVFHGRMELADAALVPNGFVALGSADFLDFDITIVSGGIGFNFKLDEDIFNYNRPNQSDPRTIYGVRLNANGDPVRFDSTNADYSKEWVSDMAYNYQPPFLSLMADDSFNLVLLDDGRIARAHLLAPTDVVATPFAGYWWFDNNGGPNVPDYSWALWTITPVPEPETYALMLAGLGLVGFAARTRAR
jgi:hypothetical protein